MAEKKTTTYARNPEQMARALGLNLSPRKRKKSLQMVGELLGETGFPKKTGKGWVVAEVLKWIDAAGGGSGKWRVTSDKPGKNSSRITHHSSLAGDGGKGKEEGGPSASDSDAASGKDGQLKSVARSEGVREDADLFGKLTGAELAEARERRLDYLQDIWIHPGQRRTPSGGAFLRLDKGERDELRGGRPWLFESVGGEHPTTNVQQPTSSGMAEGKMKIGELPKAESQKMLALYLAEFFAGRVTCDIDEQRISNWKQKKWAGEVPGNTPKPPEKMGNRFDTNAWAVWFEKYILPYYQPKVSAQGELVKGLMQMASEANYQRDIDDARRARVEADDAERRLSNKWIETDVAEALGGGWARQYHGFWRNAIEKRSAERYGSRLKEIGVTEGQAGMLMDFWVEERRDELGLVERQCEAAAAEYKKLVAEEAGRKGLTANGH